MNEDTNIERDKKRARMTRMVRYMAAYWATYDKQINYSDYSDKTFLDDALYAIGITLDPKYKFANGYREFKKYLLEYLND